MLGLLRCTRLSIFKCLGSMVYELGFFFPFKSTLGQRKWTCAFGKHRGTRFTTPCGRGKPSSKVEKSRSFRAFPREEQSPQCCLTPFTTPLFGIVRKNARNKSWRPEQGLHGARVSDPYGQYFVRYEFFILLKRSIFFPWSLKRYKKNCLSKICWGYWGVRASRVSYVWAQWFTSWDFFSPFKNTLLQRKWTCAFTKHWGRRSGTLSFSLPCHCSGGLLTAEITFSQLT